MFGMSYTGPNHPTLRQPEGTAAVALIRKQLERDAAAILAGHTASPATTHIKPAQGLKES